MANLVKIKLTRTCAKNLKVRTYSSLLFSKIKSNGQKPFMSRVGEIVITDGKVLLSISILSLAIIC
jgi:hypothetical protein